MVPCDYFSSCIGPHRTDSSLPLWPPPLLNMGPHWTGIPPGPLEIYLNLLTLRTLTGADIQWLLKQYGWHKPVVRGLLESFLIKNMDTSVLFVAEFGVSKWGWVILLFTLPSSCNGFITAIRHWAALSLRKSVNVWISYVAVKDFCEALVTLNSCLDNHLINLI